MVMVTPKNKVYVTATVCFHTYASLFPTMVPKYLNQHVGFVFCFFFERFSLVLSAVQIQTWLNLAY